MEPTTKVCTKCGVVYETENEEKHFLLCSIRSKIIVYCRGCGTLMYDMVYHPHMKLPEPKGFFGMQFCDECLNKANKAIFYG